MKKIACVGDSITWGFLIVGRSRYSYPAVLQGLLGADYEVRNFGHNDASAQKRSDTPYWTRAAYRESLEWEPDVVVIMLGTNDTKRINWNRDRFREDYSALVDSYASLPSAPKIFLCTPIRIYRLAGIELWALHEKTLEREIRPLIREIAAEKGLPVIDTFQSINSLTLLTDGIHPNRKGAALLARYIHNALISFGV